MLLGRLPGDDVSEATSINASGEIAGWGSDGFSNSATVWIGGIATNLGVGQAYAINDQGDVVGLGLGATLWASGTTDGT